MLHHGENCFTKEENTVTITFQNIRSLGNKIDLLEHILIQEKIEILIL